MSDDTFDLVWMQRMGGGTEVLKRGIPAADALATLQKAERDPDLSSAPGGVCFLRPSGEQSADYWRIQAQDTLLELHQRETDVAALRSALDDLYDDWQGPDTDSTRRARRMLETTPEPSVQQRAVADVLAERERQDAKWGEQNNDPFCYLTVLAEEFGELAQAALHSRFGGPAADNLRIEAVHVSSVALAIVECLDRGLWRWPVEAQQVAALKEELERLRSVYRQLRMHANADGWQDYKPNYSAGHNVLRSMLWEILKDGVPEETGE